MHLFHRWAKEWGAPEMVDIGFSRELAQRRECLTCKVVEYRIVTAGFDNFVYLLESKT
jgi:hypothetical protein